MLTFNLSIAASYTIARTEHDIESIGIDEDDKSTEGGSYKIK